MHSSHTNLQWRRNDDGYDDEDNNNNNNNNKPKGMSLTNSELSKQKEYVISISNKVVQPPPYK
jgi:hypothetical protein